MPYTRGPPFRRRHASAFSLPSLIIALLATSLCLPQAVAQQSQPNQAAADYFVSSLPGAPEPLLKTYAGHIEVTPEHHGNLFFWLYEHRQSPKRDQKKDAPLVIWFNGGPGCSSMDGALMEIGPYRVNSDGTLRVQDGGWDEEANVLFVDNPVGTGFSYVDGDALVSDLDEMADQMIVFLEKWFEIFEEYKDKAIFIAGESYAGQHIPYIASAILARNKQHDSNNQWNVQGLLIGNGWISGEDQYTSYIPFALETGIMKSGSQADKDAKKQESICLRELSRCTDKGCGRDKVDIGQCEQIMMSMSRDLSEDGQCYNVYDVRLKDSYPSCGMNWPPDLENVKPYLRRDDVIKALNINSDKKTGWTECNNQVGVHFKPHNLPSKTLLPALLEQMPIVLFSGDKDLICNHIGTENLISTLEWNGETGLGDAKAKEWKFDNEAAGQYTMARNLTYLRFYDSSHMVPFDYPKRAQDMLRRFITLDSDSDNGHSVIEEEKEAMPAQPTKPAEPTEPKPSDSPDNASDNDDEAGKGAEWLTYRRSGEAALVVVVIAATIWGIFIWRSRRRRRLGYAGVSIADPDSSRTGGGRGILRWGRERFGLGEAEERFRDRERDMEAAEELEDMDGSGRSKEQYALADDDEDDDREDHRGQSGRVT